MRSTIDSRAIEQAREAVLTDDYQPTLPGDGSGEGSGQVLAREHQREIRYIDTRDLERDQPTAGSTLLSYILWGGIVFAVALLLFWMATELLKYGGDEAAIAQGEAAPAAPDLAVIERPLGDAEELAHRGEYREAIHTLLLRTLQELARTASVRVAPAMTSREILGRVPLLADARDALAGLITAVELTHFGDDDASEADYVRCRAQFQVFAAAFRGGAVAPRR
ncbi:MAG TPA: DUF4129 domain-containing protein [Kofleriaceae bacterium]|nr:DUF4129 domain-containing protein [Kofleriaceae bacterium]